MFSNTGEHGSLGWQFWQPVQMLLLPVVVLLSLHRVAVLHELELGHGKGVANTANQLSGRMPLAVREDMQELLDLGSSARGRKRKAWFHERSSVCHIYMYSD
jgi:hypothetical protein